MDSPDTNSPLEQSTPAAAKPWYASKTLWTNFASILGAAGLAALGTITPETAGATAALAAGNVVLRAMTNQAIITKKGDPNA